MTPLQVAIALGVQFAAALAIGGLALRRRAHLARFFGVYLVVGLATDVMMMSWPSQFYVWHFWLFRQTILDVLKILIAVELAYRIFMGFPGAAHTTRSVLFLLLLGTLVAVLALPNEAAHHDRSGYYLGELRPRVEMAAVWMLTALAGLVVWYRIPLHPFHKAIMQGFVPYLVVFSTMLKLVAQYGWSRYLTALGPVAYLIACSWWAWASWRPEPAYDVDPELVARLQPWRAS
jgi:hypothetical protein